MCLYTEHSTVSKTLSRIDRNRLTPSNSVQHPIDSLSRQEAWPPMASRLLGLDVVGSTGRR